MTVAIGTNPGGGTLCGTLTVAAVNGVAHLQQPVDQQGGHGLHPDGRGRQPDRRHLGQRSTSPPAAASKVAFTAQPSSTTAGASISPAVQVSVEDANGNVVTSDNSSVTVAIGTNPGGGTLGGTLTVAAVNGVATFSNLSINKAGTGYTLTAADGSLTGATSSSFNVTRGGGEQGGLHRAAQQHGGGGQHRAGGAGVGGGRQRQRGHQRQLQRDRGHRHEPRRRHARAAR